MSNARCDALCWQVVVMLPEVIGADTTRGEQWKQYSIQGGSSRSPS